MKNFFLYKPTIDWLSKLSQKRILIWIIFNSIRQALIVFIVLLFLLGLFKYSRGLIYDNLDFAIASFGFLLMFIRSLMESKFGKVWK